MRNVLALDVRHLELGIVTALTAALAAMAVPCGAPASAPAMPAPSPEPVTIRQTQVTSIACDDTNIETIVLKGRVHALGRNQLATFHFRFAELPSDYAIMVSGANGGFEVRIPRAELGIANLCSLPTAGMRNASFSDGQLSIEYVLEFER